MDVRCGRVDVSHDTIERPVVIGKKFGSVAVQSSEMAEILDQPCGLGQIRGQIRLLACAQAPHAGDFAPEHLWQPCELHASPLRVFGPSNEKIEGDRRPGQKEPEQEPSFGGFWRPPERDDHQHQKPEDPLRNQVKTSPRRCID